MDSPATRHSDFELLLRLPERWRRTSSRHVARLGALQRRFARRHPHLVALIKLVAITGVLIVFLVPVAIPSYTHRPGHYKALERRCDQTDYAEGCANRHNEKIFISAILYDGDGSLAGGGWGERVLRLIHLLGNKKVFLSVYESDSGPAGQASLSEFQARIPCPHAIVSDDHVSLADFPTLTLPDGSRRVKRIAYLAELRNRALRPLDMRNSSMPIFDKVLFLNDVIFDPMEAAHLLFSTNVPSQGAIDAKANYVAACALDYFSPFRLYDLYATRDADGFSTSQSLFPFFRPRGRGLTRADLVFQTDAVRVRSCWNGMMAAQARYLQNPKSTLPWPDFQKIGAHDIDPDSPSNVTAPVRFRHEPEAYYDACECCLFSADLAQVARDHGEGGAGAGEAAIFLNPFVRVAYTDQIFGWLAPVRRWERLFVLLFNAQSLFETPTENPYRQVGQGDPFEEEIWQQQQQTPHGSRTRAGASSEARWRVVNRTGRSGLFCGVREMQLMRGRGKLEKRPGTPDRNWSNTRRPPGQALQFKSWWSDELGDGWKDEFEALGTQEERDRLWEVT